MTTSNSANTKQSNNASQKRKPIHNGYFNHPTSSSSNIPMSILIREQGLEIYGLYWVMLEESSCTALNAASISRQWKSSPIYSMPNPNILSPLPPLFPGVPAKDTTRIYTLCRLFAKNLPSEVISPAPPTGIHRQRTAADDYARRTESHGLYWLVMEKFHQQPQHFLAPQTLLPSSRTFMM